MIKNKVIIDCDPGIDDCFALGYALNSNSLEILAISCVAGNVSCDMTTKNTCNFLNELDFKIPVFSGAKKPLVGEPIIATYAHGLNGLGGYNFASDNTDNLVVGNCIELLYKKLISDDEKKTIFILGPCTNIALLLLSYPQVTDYIENIYIMGGGFDRGNYTATSEFNIVADPLAAQIVLNSGIDIKLIPLDLTETVIFDIELLTNLQYQESKTAKLLFDIMNGKYNILEFNDAIRFYIHDLLTIIAFTNKELFTFTPCYVDVELGGFITKGQTIVENRDNVQTKTNVEIAIDCSRQEIVDLFEEVIVNAR